MKTVILIMILLGVCSLNTVLAQADIKNKTITANYNQQPLSTILKDIETRYGISFSYSSGVADETKITINVKEVSFTKFMNELCSKAGLDFELINNSVILKKAAPKKAPTQIIRGQILDGATQQPVEGAIVKIDGTTPLLAAMTDSLGNFRIEDVPVGRRTISISSVGYSDNIFPDVVIDAAKEFVMSVQMTQSDHKLGEVAVYGVNRGKPLNDLASVSATSITAEETKRFVVAAFDPARVALNFAGVASNGDLSNELVVRGNSPKGVMYRMEGVEILNPNHFSALGASGGNISMLSSSTLAACDFYTGAFPAEYGDATSGVMDLKLRNGNSERREHSFMLGVLGIEAATEGYFSKKSQASYIVNYRYSTLALMKTFLKSLQNAAPDYQDLSFKINIPTHKAGTFSVWGIMGQSGTKKDAESDTTKWLNDFDATKLKRIDLKGSYGISHKIILTPQSYLQSTLAFSGEGAREVDYQSYYDTAFHKRLTDDITLRDLYIRLSELYNWKPAVNSTLRIGLIASTINFSYKFKDQGIDSPVPSVRYNSAGWSEMLEAYAQWQQKLSSRWTINGGLHYTHLFLNNTFAIDPRASATFNVNEHHSLGLSLGMHSKPEHSSLLLYNSTYNSEITTLPNKYLKMPKAFHAVLGYTFTFLNDFQLKTELYYQYLFDIGVAKDSNSAISLINADNFHGAWDAAAFVSKGTGMNYGIDITLQKFFSKNYYFLFTSSLFNSTYRTLSGKTYNTAYDRNYTINALGGKEFRVGKHKASIIGTNAKILVMGGNRYTPVDEIRSKETGTLVLDNNRVNQSQAPLYFRFDLGVSFKFNSKRATHTLMLDIQNVTNRMNIWSQYYDTKTKSVQYVYQQGIFPLFNYRVEFTTR